MTAFRGLMLAATLSLLSVHGWRAAAQPHDRSLLYDAEYPLIGDDGQRVPNHAVRNVEQIDALPGVVTVGNPTGAVTLAEFYDLNCPFCRTAATDIGKLVDADSKLKLILVPFPVLGENSIAASRVELAVAKLGTPNQFYDFYRRMFAQRRIAGGQRAIAVAHELGFDEHALVTEGDSDEVTRTMKLHFMLGNSLGLAATPSFVIGGVAIIGYPGPYSLKTIVHDVGACGEVTC